MKRIVVGILLALVVWAGLRYLPMGEPAPPAGEAVWPGDLAERAKSVSLRVGAERFRATRNATGWYAGIPGAAVSPRADVESLMATLSFVSATPPSRRLGRLDQGRAAIYGLAEPEIVLQTRAGVDWLLEIGRANASRDGVYAASSLEPGTLLLLPPDYADRLSHPPRHYFDTRLLRFDEREVQEVALKAPVYAWRVVRTGQEWSFAGDDAAMPLSQDDFEFYLHTLGTMRATGLDLHRDAPPAERPTAVVTVRTKERTHAVEVFRDVAAGVILGSSSWQPGYFGLDQDRYDQLIVSSFALRDRTVLSLDLGRVELMHLSDGQTYLEARKNKAGWIDERDGRDLLGLDVLLWRLSDLTFEREPRGSLPEDARRVFVWDLFDTQGELVAGLSFFRDPGLEENLVWLKRQSGDSAWPVSAKLLSDLAAQLPVPARTGTERPATP